MKTRLTLSYFFSFLFWVLAPNTLWAAACSDVFPTTIASAKTGTSVTLNYGSNIVDSPGNSITTTNLIQNDPAPCNGSTCSSSGSTSTPSDASISYLGGSNIATSYRGRTTLSPGHYGSFQANTESTVTFTPGDYYFNGRFSVESLAELVIRTAGTVRIFVNNDIALNSSSYTNISGSGRYLYLHAEGNFAIHSDSTARAFVYAVGTADFNSNSTFTGGVASESNIAVQNNATINYDAAALGSMDFGASCGAPSVPSLDHFEIDIGGGAGSTCSDFSVTISAMDSSDTLISAYGGDISITTSTNHGDWSKTSTASDANGSLSAGGSDSGAASYTFDAADNGSIILNLSNSHAESLTITVADTDASVSSTSSTLSFSDNAFVFTYDSDVIAGRNHTFNVAMMKRSPAPSSTVCAVATAYNQGNVKIYLTRSAQDPGGAAPVATNAGGSDSETLTNSYAGAPSLNLGFSSGVASFSLSTSDVGKYAINLVDDSGSFAQSNISGSSSDFVVRPFAFHISASANPGASSAAGSTYVQAGQSFTVSARAVAWQSADDSNGDGAPDYHDDSTPGNNANLSDNASLPSFGLESTGETLSLSADLYAPAGGNNPGLSGSTTATSPSSGSLSATVSFNEVGIIEIASNVSSGNYLSMGTTRSAKMLSRSGYVGRFYPDHFSLVSSSVDEACTAGFDFSYMDQDFQLSFALQARSISNTKTQNYTGAFAKLGISELVTAFSAVDSGTDLRSRIVLQGGSFAWVLGELATDASLSLARASSPDGPFEQVEFGLNPVDTDGVSLPSADLDLDADSNGSSDAIKLGEGEFRFGRLLMESAFGPETAALPTRFVTEYWDGSIWVLNDDDSCTSIALTDIRYNSTSISGSRVVSIGSGSTTGQYGAIGLISVGFVNGDGQQSFTAPGSGNTGSFEVDVNLSAYPWLQFDWNGDGLHDDVNLPSAEYSFGQYRGHDRVLYWHEVLQ